jgi:hypothetical protein
MEGSALAGYHHLKPGQVRFVISLRAITEMRFGCSGYRVGL